MIERREENMEGLLCFKEVPYFKPRLTGVGRNFSMGMVVSWDFTKRFYIFPDSLYRECVKCAYKKGVIRHPPPLFFSYASETEVSLCLFIQHENIPC